MLRPEVAQQVLGASTALGGPSIPQDDTGAVQHDIGALQGSVEVCLDELELMREVRVFYARVIEGVERAVETAVVRIASEVLGRELLLGPVDVEAIVDRALAQFASEKPLRVRVYPSDVEKVHCGVPVVADASLRIGDAVLELRDGSVDASLDVRFAALLEAAR